MGGTDKSLVGHTRSKPTGPSHVSPVTSGPLCPPVRCGKASARTPYPTHDWTSSLPVVLPDRPGVERTNGR